MGRFVNLVTFEEAVSRIRKTQWNPISTESINPELSSGRITSTPLHAVENVPKWNRSLVDGYAVRSEDCRGVSETNPLSLGINGIVEAGRSSFRGFIENHCTEIYTGGLLPPDYNAVVMAEDVERSGDSVSVLKTVKPWENVQRIGDDVPSSSEILGNSDIIRPWHISALISSKVQTVEVYRKLRIGIISTGNELFEGSEGYIPNTTQRLYLDYLNRPFLKPESGGVSHDDVQEIRKLIRKSLERNDCVIVTGGTSLGGRDEVPEAMAEIGNVIFAGSMIRPGRTLTMYESQGKPVFSVSGIPIPSLMSFDVYFEEYLKIVTGIKAYHQEVSGRLSSPITNNAGYLGIHRVTYFPGIDGSKVEIAKSKGSGSLASILNSNAVLLVTGDKEGLPEGTVVKVKLLGDTK